MLICGRVLACTLRPQTWLAGHVVLAHWGCGWPTGACPWRVGGYLGCIAAAQCCEAGAGRLGTGRRQFVSRSNCQIWSHITVYLCRARARAGRGGAEGLRATSGGHGQRATSGAAGCATR